MYYGARFYDPQIGLFVSPDTIVPDAGRVFAYNRSMYVAGNPLRLRDSSGHFWETALDVASVGYDVYDIYENGLTWSSAGSLAVDVAGAAIPFVPSAGACVRWCDEAAQVGGKAAGYVGDKVDDAWKWTKGALGFGDEAAQYGDDVAEGTDEAVALITASSTQKHHIFPQKYEKQFQKLGITIDDFTVELPQKDHLKGVHGKGGFVGSTNQMFPVDNWNKRWEQFFKQNPNASVDEVYKFVGALMDEYGINSLPIVPYK